jgi:ADP-ribose pyrophosphatase YjhB (NUDIX family)
MYRRNIPLIPQEKLGYHLGLVIPDDVADLFWNPRVGQKPNSGYGTQLQNYDVNKIFKELEIPLFMTYTSITNFHSPADLRQYLNEKLATDIDLLACFDWGKLHKDNPSDEGHVVVIDKVADNKIRIIDPSRSKSKWQTHKINQLYEAMQAHGKEKMGGIWEFQLYAESGGGIVVNSKNQIALVKSDRDEFIGYPKGHRENGEADLKSTAIREIKKETGITYLKDIEFLGEIYRDRFDKPNKRKMIRIYLARTEQMQLRSEEENPFWCDLTEVPSKLTTRADKQFFLDNIERIKEYLDN